MEQATSVAVWTLSNASLAMWQRKHLLHSWLFRHALGGSWASVRFSSDHQPALQAALKRNPKVQQYSRRADLNELMPNYEVKLGFGLHVGMANKCKQKKLAFRFILHSNRLGN